MAPFDKGGGNDRISYKAKCKRKKEKGTGIATGWALAMTMGLDSPRIKYGAGLIASGMTGGGLGGSYALWHYFHLVEFIRPYIGE